MSREVLVALVLVVAFVTALAAPVASTLPQAEREAAGQAGAREVVGVGLAAWTPIRVDGGCETGGAGGCPIRSS
jgi:hypothetical protein